MIDDATLGRGLIADALFGGGADSAAAIGWANTFLPLALLVLLAIALPVLTVPRGVLGQKRLALGMALAGVLVLASALAIFAVFHLRTSGTIRPGALIRPALMTALVWGPVWALVWLARAQGVEARKGRATARAGLDVGREG